MTKKKQSAKVQPTYVKFMQNRPLMLTKAVVDLGLAYWFALIAIDSGSYWHYLLVILFVTFAVKAGTWAIKGYEQKP